MKPHAEPNDIVPDEPEFKEVSEVVCKPGGRTPSRERFEEDAICSDMRARECTRILEAKK